MRGFIFFLKPKPKLNNMKQQAITTSATDIALRSMGMYMQHINQLQDEADKAFETLLALYLTPEAFAVIKRFQSALSEEYASGELFSLRFSLNDLAEPSDGPEVLRRTLKTIMKEQESA